MEKILEPTFEFKLNGKLVQLEPISQRVKMYRMPYNSTEKTVGILRDIAQTKHCDKLIFYLTEDEQNHFTHKREFIYEGTIREFFRGEHAYIYSLFLNPERQNGNPEPQHEDIAHILKQMNRKQEVTKNTDLPDGYTLHRPDWGDAVQMAELYKSVFRTYPTPMHNPDYVFELLQKPNVHFTTIKHKNEIVSACSADVLTDFNSAEMSDCATLPEHRGKGLLSHQFFYLMQLMKRKKIRTLFSYSRSASVEMNLVNVKFHFSYGGCMILNSNISGSLENMNIWYKVLT